MSILVLVRHGTSEYNIKGLWTGWDDPSLNEKGVVEAKKAGESLKDIHFDLAYTSALKRAIETFKEIEKASGIQIPLVSSEKLNERNYGIYTAKNKWEIEKEVG